MYSGQFVNGEQCYGDDGKNPTFKQVQDVFLSKFETASLEDIDEYTQEQLCYLLKTGMLEDSTSTQKKIDKERLVDIHVEGAYYNGLVCNGVKNAGSEILKTDLVIEFMKFFQDSLFSRAFFDKAYRHMFGSLEHTVERVGTLVMAIYTKTQVCFIMTQPPMKRKLWTPKETQIQINAWYREQYKETGKAKKSLEELKKFKTFLVSGHGVMNPSQPITTLPDHVILMMMVNPGCSLEAVRKTEGQLWKTFADIPYYFQNLLLTDQNAFPKNFYFKNNLFYIGGSCCPNICISFTDEKMRSGIFSRESVRKTPYIEGITTSTQGTLYKSYVTSQKELLSESCDTLYSINNLISHMDITDGKRNKIIILQTCANFFSNINMDEGNTIIQCTEECSRMSNIVFGNYFTRFPITHTPKKVLESFKSPLLLSEIHSFEKEYKEMQFLSRGFARIIEPPWYNKWYDKVRKIFRFYTDAELLEIERQKLGVSYQEFYSMRAEEERNKIQQALKLKLLKKIGCSAFVQHARNNFNI